MPFGDSSEYPPAQEIPCAPRFSRIDDLLLTLHAFQSLFTIGGFTVALLVSLFSSNMTSSQPSLRKRGGKKDAYTALPSDDGSLNPVSISGKTSKPQSEWDYWLAMTILTLLAFVTRFWRIDYPNQVVFDEVHFGKVQPLKWCSVNREEDLII